MTKKSVLTTGAVAEHCHVSSETVVNWIRQGKIKAFSTAGGHRRIHVEDFHGFLEAYDMPAWEEEEEISVKPRILIVDDETEIVTLIEKTLRGTGKYELASAGDGFEAGIQVMEFLPDLIILDLMMPYLNGFKVCRMIKDNPNTKHIIVLVVTGYPQGGNMERALECGAEFCMAKPFNLAELKEKIDELLMGKHPSIVSLSKVS
jgi:excisionase family DNA binding protein